MCWSPDDGMPVEAPETRGSNRETTPDETAATAPGGTPKGEGVAVEEGIAVGRRWQAVLIRLTSLTLAIAAVFTAGFLVHAAVNWPDFHRGPQVLDLQKLQQKATPHEGVTLQAQWGDLLPRLVSAGVIDIDKFKTAASRSGQPLTADETRLLTDGGDDAIHIDRHNVKFILNALWAVGLATDSVVLSDGPMSRAQNGGANLASTGGWTLGKQAGPTYLGKLKLIPLTGEQRQVLNDVANGVYRPCCNNPTAFPDCNHGMAALGLAEIMASQGASADDIFRGLKAFNAYWFPDQYLTLAVYYRQRGIKWEKVDPRELLDGQHSGSAGWNQIDAAVKEESPLLPKSGGGGCSA